MKPRVLLCVPHTLSAGGGAEQYASELASRLHRDAGWHTVLVSCDRAVRRLTLLPDRGGLRRYSLPALAVWSRTPIGVGWTRDLRSIIRQEGISLVNGHAPVPGIADAAARAVGDLPYVLTYHAGSMAKGSVRADVPIWLYEHVGLRLTSARADQVITSSDYVSLAFSRYFSAKATTVAPGVDTKAFRPGAPQRDGPLIFVGVLGRGARRKGLDDLLAALSLVRRRGHDLTLTVVGGGDSSAYHALVRRLEVSDAVRFTGRLSQAELRAEYQRSRALIHPSHDDSFPMAVMEAQASGLAVVATDVGGLPGLVQDGQQGLVVSPGDVEGLATAMIRVAEDDELRERLGSAGRGQAELMTWDVRLDQTLEVFAKAGRRRASRGIWSVPAREGGRCR